MLDRRRCGAYRLRSGSASVSWQRGVRRQTGDCAMPGPCGLTGSAEAMRLMAYHLCVTHTRTRPVTHPEPVHATVGQSPDFRAQVRDLRTPW